MGPDRHRNLCGGYLSFLATEIPFVSADRDTKFIRRTRNPKVPRGVL